MGSSVLRHYVCVFHRPESIADEYVSVTVGLMCVIDRFRGDDKLGEYSCSCVRLRGAMA